MTIKQLVVDGILALIWDLRREAVVDWYGLGNCLV